MSQSDRVFLEEACPLLLQRLLEDPAPLAAKLAEDPGAQVQEHDIQDFEVGYSLSSEGPELRLKVIYPFLSEVLDNGSRTLLSQVLDGLPVRGVDVSPESCGKGLMVLGVNVTAVAEDEAACRRCATVLASLRQWLLIGPLVERLRWLRDTTAAVAAASKAALPGEAAAAVAAARGRVPEALELRVRRLETCWIVTKEDRVLIIFSVHLEDEVDVALGRAFCQEFAETGQRAKDFAPPCVFSEPRDLPNDLRDRRPAEAPNVGYLTLTLSDQAVRGASDERLCALAKPAMTWRNFFHFHLKHAKGHLHSRLRKHIEYVCAQVQRTRRQPQDGAKDRPRRTPSGKESFGPPARGPAPPAAPFR